MKIITRTNNLELPVVIVVAEKVNLTQTVIRDKQLLESFGKIVTQYHSDTKITLHFNNNELVYRTHTSDDYETMCY